MQGKRIITLALAAVLAFPVAAANWKALGSQEPDTTQDVEQGYMFTDPNLEYGVNKVYFNVVSTVSGPYDTAINPNSADLGSRILPIGAYTFNAFYGVWLDCNKDGYIGAQDTALIEYPEQMLPADHVCGTPTNAPENRGGNMFYQQGWVTELRWIGRHGGADGNNDGKPDGRDARIISDYGSDIWGDYGLPGTPIGVSSAEQCLVRYHTTGGMLNYADCTSGHQVGEANGVLADLGQGFEENPDGSVNFDSPHALNVATFGEDDANDRAFTVYDCGSGEQNVDPGLGASQQVDETPTGVSGYRVPGVRYTDEDGHLNFTVFTTQNTGSNTEESTIAGYDPNYYAPGPSLGPGGSVAGAYNHTLDGNCDATDGGGNIYGSETVKDVRERAKSTVDITFAFYEEQRSGAGKRGSSGAGAPTGSIYPIFRSGLLITGSGNQWYANNWWVGNTPPLARVDLDQNNPANTQVVAQGSEYITFYANFSEESGTHALITPSSPGIYGNEWCQGQTDGVVNGFNCNPDEWYINADGSPVDNRMAQAFAQHAYMLKDTDCFDYHVTGGVYASGAMVDSSTACI